MIATVLSRLDAAYPSAEDRSKIESYLATVEGRRAALDEVRHQAGPVADRVMAGIRARYPQFARYRPTGYDKGHRDMVLLSNMVGNATFLGEHESLDDMFTHWYKTILKAAHMSPQFMRDTFALWHEALKACLSPAAWGLVRPHAEHLAEILTDLPVPARDETGERRTISSGLM
ncbi:hypothetical protein [Gemmata sp.]|uniref:hypothetical protein n=1 Tax=Gemmata sp. TaxID=1914242 RepID=UPI003F72C9E7